jgi:hypothetical protein
LAAIVGTVRVRVDQLIVHTQVHAQCSNHVVIACAPRVLQAFSFQRSARPVRTSHGRAILRVRTYQQFAAI